MLRAPFILSACSGSWAVTKNTETLKYFSLIHMEEMDEKTEFNTLKTVPTAQAIIPLIQLSHESLFGSFRQSLSIHVVILPRPYTA